MAETRQALRQAALEMSLADGPDAVTVEAICERAGVSRRTFFNYFRGKDDAVVGWSAAEGARCVAIIVGRPAGEAGLEAVEAAVGDLMEATVGSPFWLRLVGLLRDRPEMVDRVSAVAGRLEEFLCAGLAERTGRPPTDPWVVLLAGTGTVALRVSLARWLDAPPGTDARALLRDTFDVLRGGLRIDGVDQPRSQATTASRTS